MKWEELKPWMSVRIVKDHTSGFGERRGKVEAIGTFEGISKRIAALVDIGEVLPVVLEPEGLNKDDLPA
ncbi:hypothetical protein [Paenibacillus monticola]|uniref:KOW domain-containing protein n=1 Tax=Paenibacillus monticola TaxID=2666075 RepID=A0A7X2KZS5_9BACL|nr:hypothetical protein [Paenibacillus monticola]MRN52012.1 hypothetical protein [Paenibacillus monticola]